MFAAVTMGMVLGLSAGISPGPLFTLVITETLRSGLGGGIRVAMAPLITDLPIVIFTLLVLTGLSQSQILLGVLSLTGAVLVVVLGIENLRADMPEIDAGQVSGRSLIKGIAVNAVSPHPYLFWLSVGGPLFLKAFHQRAASGILFLGCFYAMLIGAKVTIALLVNRSRSFLTRTPLRLLMRVLGLLLIGFSVLLIRDGLKLLGMTP